MLQAYFDESERDCGVFCVAGFVFAPEQAKKFAKEWEAVFPDGFHMTDFASGRKQFKHLSQIDRDLLLRRAIEMVNQRISFGVVISCDIAEMHRLTPGFIRGFGHAYPICCHTSMLAIAHYLRDKGLPETVAYIFESGHKCEAEARDFIKLIATTKELKEAYAYGSDAFIPKADAIPLQAADLFAWEWTKYIDETRWQGKRPIRRSLIALFARGTKRFKLHHLTGPLLAKHLEQVRQLGILEWQEQQEAKQARKAKAAKIGEGPIAVGPCETDACG